VRYWDSSAIVPLLVSERTSPAVLEAVEQDPQIVVWWATEVECISAITRRERDGALDASDVAAAADRLGALAASWRAVEPITQVRQTAIRLLRTHPLRAADALQLAAALMAAGGSPGALPFVTLDDRLVLAAQREGFPVVQPA
jgi:predicted nucleic acid-binding protein